MTYKGASFLVLFWGIFNLLGGGLAFYFMGSFAQPVLILGALSAFLGFSLGHFLNRGRKQAFLSILGACTAFVFLYGWLTSQAFSQDKNYIFPDALADPSRNVYLLVSSAQLTITVLVLLILLVFSKPIYLSLQNKI
ncbi:hypothetical protein AHMF7616_01632 [Adhaeribacter pallidiroseus]|uniref:Uncharacterized protein n=2 Tax=Adhaeribacter pallidiroseus TaxID=2072847 RepID=A0A369QDN4_9BACT|nr:hypothetical protein AHMF7616_01632 [Adhaeribacter pallidiroseus]